MADTADGPDESGIIRRACDQCRTRKIRCDKQTPCSNCHIAQRTCSSTGLGQKPKETRQRVLISHQYERKIDHFEARLGGIEEMLRKLTTSLSQGKVPAPSAAPPSFRSPSVAASSTAYEEPSTETEDDDEQAFEGNSSMTAHTVFASEFLEQAVTSTPLGPRLSPDIQKALASLQQMVHMLKQKSRAGESRLAHQKAVPRGGVSRLPMPPSQVVVQILREIKDQPPMSFMLSCAFIAAEDFIESCRKVYFATEDYSIAIFLIVNGGLYYLFQEKAVLQEENRADFLGYHYMCRDNMETALANLPLLMPPKMEMIEALLLGATYAVETSKFTLAWQLTSPAAAMCQTLGWHRLPAAEDEASDKKAAIFWFCYMLDKGLALRFGRSSTIQDWDISVPRRFGNINMAEPWKHALNMWIIQAGVMGEAYEQLYSPAALARSPQQRTEAARLLIEKVELVRQRWEVLRKEREAEQEVGHGVSARELEHLEWRMMTMAMIFQSDNVSHYAHLTLLYRAIPNGPGLPGTFNAECIEAARMAIKSHQECMEMTSASLFVQAGYLHWTILYAPFLPFIVLFCHVIETSNHEDLQRLAHFVSTLQPVISMSAAIEKLHRLSQMLYSIASLYAEAKAQQQQDQDMSMVGNDFDMYLSQLGLMPQQPSGEGMAAGDQFAGSEAPATSTAQLGDWFSGNRHIMGLLEEDLSEFSPALWNDLAS